MPKEHPIIFNSEMVGAILDGRKKQTRRIIKNPQKLEGLMLKGEESRWCPYGKVGDTLWVKEDYKYLIQGDLVITYYKYSVNEDRVKYTPLNSLDEKTRKKLLKGKQDVWKSKLLMFKFMARIFLEITNIRVERVQDISPKEARLEGIKTQVHRREVGKFRYGIGNIWSSKNAPDAFKKLWDSLNAKRGYGWDKNSLVWVIEFKKGK